MIKPSQYKAITAKLQHQIHAFDDNEQDNLFDFLLGDKGEDMTGPEEATHHTEINFDGQMTVGC